MYVTISEVSRMHWIALFFVDCRISTGNHQ